MPEIRADLRSVAFEPQPEAVAAADVLCARIHEDQIALAKALEVIDRSAAFVAERCASIGEFVLRRGLSPFQGQALRFVGRAMRAFAWVEPGLREGHYTFDQAESLGRLCSFDGTLREDDDWETWARFLPLRTLRGKVRRRIEEVRQGTGDLVPFHTHLTREAYADYQRAQSLASRKAQKPLSRGQTIAAVLRDFNRRHDPEERQARKRRVGDTSGPRCRTVPAEVTRACIKRYGNRCWVPGCTNEIFLENMHHTPKSEGGSQEEGNIDRGCHPHHVMYDAGAMWQIGTNEQSLPIFETDEGLILHPDFPGRPLRKSKVQPERTAPPEGRAQIERAAQLESTAPLAGMASSNKTAPLEGTTPLKGTRPPAGEVAPLRPTTPAQPSPPTTPRNAARQSDAARHPDAATQRDAPPDRIAEAGMVWNGRPLPRTDRWATTADVAPCGRRPLRPRWARRCRERSPPLG